MFRSFAFSILILFFVLACLQPRAQESIILDGFVGVPQAQQVQLRWVISAGQTCNGTVIERSADTIHWETIGDIPGICGSSSEPIPYNFIDNTPAGNTINFYRLELGGQGYSPVIGVPYFDYSDNGFVLIPNPAYETATLYFSTSVTEKFIVLLFDITGRMAQQYSGTGGSCSMDIAWLPSGNYLFVILRQGKKNISGKLLVR
jgi:hypothetical protein